MSESGTVEQKPRDEQANVDDHLVGEENANVEEHANGVGPANQLAPVDHVASPNAAEGAGPDEPGHSGEPISWEFDIEYNKIKHVPWLADVYGRLVKVRQDIRYAIDAKGWTADEGLGA
jgi:hypothetical protein